MSFPRVSSVLFFFTSYALNLLEYRYIVLVYFSVIRHSSYRIEFFLALTNYLPNEECEAYMGKPMSLASHPKAP